MTAAQLLESVQNPQLSKYKMWKISALSNDCQVIRFQQQSASENICNEKDKTQFECSSDPSQEFHNLKLAGNN